MNLGRLAASVFVLAMVACAGGGDDDDGSSAAGSSGTAAAGAAVGGSAGTAGSVTSSGSNAVGGKSTGGTAGSSGGAASTGAHCMPGTPQPSAFFIGGIVDQCPSVSGLTGDFNHLIDIELPKPIGPGDDFAFSVDMNAPEGDFEIYGATRECGDVGEKLGAVHVLGNGIICYAIKPTTGPYTHLIWVWRVAGEMKDLALCDSGTCPAQ